MALMTISAAGFGYRVNWEDGEAPPGHKISFRRSIETVATGLTTKLSCPKWIFEWAPTRNIREAREGFAEFRVRSPELTTRWGSVPGKLMRHMQSYLVEMINERKSSYEKDERGDLLSNLVDANQDGEQTLEEEELIGAGSALISIIHLFTDPLFREYLHFLSCWTRGKDISVSLGDLMFSAAQQSSGSALCFALNMLAVHQEEQEELYKHIQDILPDGRLPVSMQYRHHLSSRAQLHLQTYQDIPRLSRVTAYASQTVWCVVVTEFLLAQHIVRSYEDVPSRELRSH